MERGSNAGACKVNQCCISVLNDCSNSQPEIDRPNQQLSEVNVEVSENAGGLRKDDSNSSCDYSLLSDQMDGFRVQCDVESERPVVKVTCIPLGAAAPCSSKIDEPEKQDSESDWIFLDENVAKNLPSSGPGQTAQRNAAADQEPATPSCFEPLLKVFKS